MRITDLHCFTWEVRIWHYVADGKLSDIGTTSIFKATGNVAFTGNTVGIYRDELDKAGNALTKIWF